MKIFWSWQADTPGKTGRHFVRAALDAAVEEIKRDLTLIEPAERDTASAVHVDQDRQGVSGIPDLAATILDKIANSAVVVADVTPVAIRDPALKAGDNAEPQKRFINSNVAIELGFALRALTDRFVLLVMNTHYGSREDLPFDLRHKAGPIIFSLPPGASKPEIENARKILTGQLVGAIRSCIAGRTVEARKQPAFPEAEMIGGPAFYFRRGDVLAVAGDRGEQEFRFTEEKVAYLRLFPTQLTAPMGLAKIVKVFEDRRPMPLGAESLGVPLRTKDGAIIFDFDGRETITMLTQGFHTGELWGINGRALITSNAGQPNETTLIPMITFEKVFFRTLRNYALVEKVALGQQPPFKVVMGVVGLQGAYLTVPGGPLNTGQRIGPIMQAGYRQEQTLQDTDDNSVKAALKGFFEGLYDLAAESRSEIMTDALVAAHDLPSR